MFKVKKNYARKHAKDFNILTRLFQYWWLYSTFLPLVTLFYKVKYVSNLKLCKNQLCVIAPNHISLLDPFVVACAVKRRLAFMAKRELFETYYLAKNLSGLGCFAVNREKLEVSTIKTVKEVFKANYNLCIFPEGGIRRNKRIEEVNKGFVAIAKMACVDILPVSISGLEEYNWNIFKKANVHVSVGEPISHTLPDEEIIECWSVQIANMSGYTKV